MEWIKRMKNYEDVTYVALIGKIGSYQNVSLKRMPQFQDVLQLTAMEDECSTGELQVYKVTVGKPLTCRIVFQMTSKKAYIQCTFQPNKLTVITEDLDVEEYIYRILRYFLIKKENKVFYLFHP
jgi:hypothetical protein